MEYLVDLWFSPLRLYSQPLPEKASDEFGLVIHLSQSRKWRRRMRTINEGRS